MEKRLTFENGKCQATITITITKKDDKPVLSISGEVRKVSYGQCYDEIKQRFPDDPKVSRIIDIWKKYHLNDMHPECEHQRELGWCEEEIKPISVSDSRMRGHVNFKEDERGLLCKPCPVCGYEYGTKWLYMPIPEEIIKELLSM